MKKKKFGDHERKDIALERTNQFSKQSAYRPLYATVAYPQSLPFAVNTMFQLKNITVTSENTGTVVS